MVEDVDAVDADPATVVVVVGAVLVDVVVDVGDVIALGGECEPNSFRSKLAAKPSVTHWACAGVTPARTSSD